MRRHAGFLRGERSGAAAAAFRRRGSVLYNGNRELISVRKEDRA